MGTSITLFVKPYLVGFGGSMYEADIISGWVDAEGKAVVKDYYSTVEGKPKVYLI